MSGPTGPHGFTDHIAPLRADWASRPHFAVLALGPRGLNDLLALLSVWQAAPERPARLDLLWIDSDAASQSALEAALEAITIDAVTRTALKTQWPLPLPGLHRLRLADGAVRLTLAVGPPLRMARRLDLAADAFLIDGRALDALDATALNGLMRSLARLARPQASLVCRLAGGHDTAPVTDALRNSGFAILEPMHAQGITAPADGAALFGQAPADTRADSALRTAGHRTLLHARYAPRWRGHPQPPAPPCWPERQALIIGAGLAGVATAAALAERGWQVALLEQAAHPMAGGSSQPAVAEHLHLSPDDNPLARLTRSALLHARGTQRDRPPAGKLQLAADAAELDQMRHCVHSLGFPGDFVQALDRESASDLAGLRLRQGGLWLPLCDWTDPRALAARLLAAHPGALRLRTGTQVASLTRSGMQWRAWSPDGDLIAEAPVVVLANAGDAPRLAGLQSLSLRRLRGQTTMLPPGALPGLRSVIGGEAYACPLPDGNVLVGSTFDDGAHLDPDPRADHSNLARLSRMLAAPGAETLQALASPAACGFRYTPHDRLPLIGPLPDEAAIRANAAELMRNDRIPLPMRPGLYGAFGFGARGLLWSHLAGAVLASLIDGGIAPLESDLLGAIAPARFLRQALRRGQLGVVHEDGRQGEAIPLG